MFLTSAGDTFRQDYVEMTLEITPERWRWVHGKWFKTSLIKPWTLHSGGSTVVPPEPLLVLEIYNYMSVKNCPADQCEASTSCDPCYVSRTSIVNITGLSHSFTPMSRKPKSYQMLYNNLRTVVDKYTVTYLKHWNGKRSVIQKGEV